MLITIRSSGCCFCHCSFFVGLVCGVQYYFMSKPTTVLSVLIGTKNWRFRAVNLMVSFFLKLESLIELWTHQTNPKNQYCDMLFIDRNGWNIQHCPRRIVFTLFRLHQPFCRWALPRNMTELVLLLWWAVPWDSVGGLARGD